MQPNSSGAPLTWFTCSPNACLNLSTCMGCTPLWRARISKSKCAKHFSLGAFLKVEMSTKCTPSWREAHVEVKTYKTHRARMCSVLGALLEVEISKNCMPLWREAHLEVNSVKSWRLRSNFGSWDFEMLKKVHAFVARAHFGVKMYKTLQPRSTFESWDVEKVHAVVARSTCRSQNVQSTSCSDVLGALLEVEISKNCTPLWREAHLEVKSAKSWRVRSMFGSWDVEKAHAFVARSTFRSQNVQSTTCSDHVLKVQMWFCVAGARDSAHGQKWAKRQGFLAFQKTMAGVGHFHEIFRFAKMILRDRCSTSYDLASLFRGRRNTLDRWWWNGKIATSIGTRPSALHSSALNFPLLKEVSQNCFVFDVVNFENWGSLAELFRFWRCQIQNWGSLAE